MKNTREILQQDRNGMFCDCSDEPVKTACVQLEHCTLSTSVILTDVNIL